MHGHGFALMYLASVYGMITKESFARCDEGNRLKQEFN